jgi:hypothetical protein
VRALRVKAPLRPSIAKSRGGAPVCRRDYVASARRHRQRDQPLGRGRPIHALRVCADAQAAGHEHHAQRAARGITTSSLRYSAYRHEELLVTNVSVGAPPMGTVFYIGGLPVPPRSPVCQVAAVGIAGDDGAFYYLKDRLGSVMALADGAGRIVESYRYDASGNVLGVYDGSGRPVADRKSAIGNRFPWQGREYSWATGFYYFRARWQGTNASMGG